MAKQRALRNIEDLMPEALADALADNGFSGCRQLIVDKGIDGKKILNLTEVQLKQYKLLVKPSELHRLWSFLVRVREHPEEFVLNDVQYLNYKPPTLKKPALLKKPAEIPAARNQIRRVSPQPVSPGISIVNSLKDNLNEKFKNARVESEESHEDDSTDWSDDEPDKRDSSNTLVPEDPHAEEEAEMRRKLSAEIFTANKQKLEKLFGGIRPDNEEKAPPRPPSLTRIYVNVEELRLEQELSKKSKPPLPTAEKPKMPLKPSSLIRNKSVRVKPPEVRRSKEEFEDKRSKINASLTKKTLPLPPKLPPSIKETKLLPPKLPPSIKSETKLFDLSKAPERPPKNGGNDEQIPYEPEGPSRPPVRPPKNAMPMNDEDDMYEPPPNVGYIPKSIERLLDRPPAIPNKFPNPIKLNEPECDDDGYLITSHHLSQSKESLFSKQDVPLPPIPSSTTPHEDELRRNAHFQDINREGAKRVLNTKQTGSFLLRPSNNYFCVLMIKGDEQIFNVPVLFKSQRYNLLADQVHDLSPIKFQSLDELIAYYKTNRITVKNTMILLKT